MTMMIMIILIMMILNMLITMMILLMIIMMINLGEGRLLANRARAARGGKTVTHEHASRCRLSNLGDLTSQEFYIFLRSFCVDSSSPQISAILVGHFTRGNDSLCKSPQFSATNAHKTCRQISILARGIP